MTHRRCLGAALALMLGLAAGRACGEPARPGENAQVPVACTGEDQIADLQRQNPGLYRTFKTAADAVPNGDALLWSITKPGTPTSYLFGTVHSSDARVVAIARTLQPFLSNTPRVATELGDVSEAVVGVKLGLRMLMSKVHASDMIASQADRDRIGALLRQRNLDPVAALKLPPWVLMTAIMFPACELDRQRHGVPIVDNVVIDLGKKAGDKIVGLETVEEQADAMESIDPKLAVAMVEMMAGKKTLADDAFATLVGRYLAHRPGDMIPLMEAVMPMSPRDTEANRAFMIIIVEKRNQIMAKRAAPLLAEGGVTIAVGALHLVGDKGLVALLRRDGWTLTKVW